jgi:hypothetical protein
MISPAPDPAPLGSILVRADLGSSSNTLVSTWFLEPDDPLNVVKALGSRLHNTQHFLTPVAKEDVHGYQHASYHYSSRSAARRRRLVRSWTLVLSGAHIRGTRLCAKPHAAHLFRRRLARAPAFPQQVLLTLVAT